MVEDFLLFDSPARGYYGTELFSILYFSKNIPYCYFVPLKKTVRNSAVRNFFRIVKPYLFVGYYIFSTNLHQQKLSRKRLPLHFLKLSCIFILLSRDSDHDQRAIRARLGVASHLSSTPRWGIPLSALPNSTTSKLAGLFFTLFL